MADVLDNAEFWLPSHFLNDDESVCNNGGISRPGNFPNVGHSFPNLSSLDEEELVAELTRQLAVSSVHRLRKASVPERAWIGSGYVEPSFCRRPESFDAIYSAVGEVARKKMMKEWPPYERYPNLYQHDKQYFCCPCESDFRRICPSRIGTPDISQANLCEALKQQYRDSQFLNERMSMSPVGHGNEMSSNAFLLEMQRQQYQNLLQSGIRGLSIKDSPGLQKKPAGTGVFLPRKYGNLPESRTKPARFRDPSQILNFKGVNVPQQSMIFMDDSSRLDRSVPSIPNVAYKSVTGLGFPESDGSGFADSVITADRRDAMRINEIRLPQEWKY